MTTPFAMPKLGEGVSEGVVTRWLKQAGEQVRAVNRRGILFHLEVDDELLDIWLAEPTMAVQAERALGLGYREQLRAGLAAIARSAARAIFDEFAKYCAPRYVAPPQRRSPEGQRDPAHGGTPQRSPRRRLRAGTSRRESPARRLCDTRLSIRADLSVQAVLLAHDRLPVGAGITPPLLRGWSRSPCALRWPSGHSDG
jgi:hypothetical protein